MCLLFLEAAWEASLKKWPLKRTVNVRGDSPGEWERGPAFLGETVDRVLSQRYSDVN